MSLKSQVSSLNAFPSLLENSVKYSLDDIYHADEFGLQYFLAPDRTISAKQLAGVKENNTRITLLACSNTSGTDKMPLRIIGNENSPRDL